MLIQHQHNNALYKENSQKEFDSIYMNIEHFTSHKRVKSFLEILNQLSFKNIKTETKLLNLYAVQLFMSAVLWELFISYK